jgi:DNA-binding transcriptional LysR family regulator
MIVICFIYKIDRLAGMELRQLEYFIAVAGEMNFSRAAQRVHVVQSALSSSVRKLEKELGVELFDRSKQQIKITPAGELFREHARRVIQTARLARDSMSDFRGELAGTVDLGSLISFGRLDVPKVVGEFHRRYPLVRIRLRQSQTGSMAYLSAIADGSLDLALVSSPDRFPSRVEMQLLSQEPMAFVCRPDHHLAQRDNVAIRDLVDEDLIGFPLEFGLRRLVEDAFKANGITAHTPYEVALEYSVAAELVRNGLGSIFMPASEAGRIPDLRAVDVRPAVVWKIYLASAEKIGPASAKLAEMLLASAGALSD